MVKHTWRTEAEKAKTIRLRKQGMDPRDIAIEVNRSLASVRTFLNVHRAGRDNYWPKFERTKRKWTKAIVKEWVRLYKEEKWTQHKIGKEYGVCNETVCVMINDYLIEEELWKE